MHFIFFTKISRSLYMFHFGALLVFPHDWSFQREVMLHVFRILFYSRWRRTCLNAFSFAVTSILGKRDAHIVGKHPVLPSLSALLDASQIGAIFRSISYDSLVGLSFIFLLTMAAGPRSPADINDPGIRLDSSRQRQRPRRKASSLRTSSRNLESSDSIPSEEGSIYNATTASSGTEDSAQVRHAENQLDDVLQNGFAANMAMFMPLNPSLEASRSPWSTYRFEAISEQGTQTRFRQSQLISGNTTTLSRNYQQTCTSLVNCSVSRLEDSDPLHHRKAVSLNDADGSLREPKWPGNLFSPISPILPKYPPPVRSPTPPGLPSFGTREAVCYSAQFLVQSTSVNGSDQQSPGRPFRRNSRRRKDDSNAAVPSGSGFRRLLGFSSSPAPPQPDRIQAPAIGRAEDGTSVQGRFPYRQSGHGVHLARHLEDHPFHRRTLPRAHSPNFDSYDYNRQSNREESGSKDGYPFPTSLPRPRNEHTRNVLPSRPTRAVTAPPRRPSSTKPSRVLSGALQCPTSACQPERPSGTVESNERSVFDALGIHGDTSGRYPSPIEPSLPAVIQSRGPPCDDAPGSKSSSLWDEYRRIVSPYLCCGIDDGPNECDMPVEPTDSNDTYATARSVMTNNTGNADATSSPMASQASSTPLAGHQGKRRCLAPLRSAYDFFSLNNLALDASLI